MLYWGQILTVILVKFEGGGSKMSSCALFGHRDCPPSLRPLLLKTLLDLIKTQSVSVFYVGNQGNFDALALSVLGELSGIYPQIRYTVVLAYLPKAGEFFDFPTLFPEEVQNGPPRFAVCRRNRWILEQSDWVVAYVTHPGGGAAQFVRLAQCKGKSVLLLPPVDPRHGGAL